MVPISLISTKEEFADLLAAKILWVKLTNNPFVSSVPTGGYNENISLKSVALSK